MSKDGVAYADVLSYYEKQYHCTRSCLLNILHTTVTLDCSYSTFIMDIVLCQLPIPAPSKIIGECRHEAMEQFLHLLLKDGYHPGECKLGLFHFECTDTGKAPPDYHMAVLYIKKGKWYYEATSGAEMGYWHGPLHVRLKLPAQPVRRWQVASCTFKKLGWGSGHF